MWYRSEGGVIDPLEAVPLPSRPRSGPPGGERDAWRHYRAVFDTVGTPTALLGLDGRVAEANPACEAVTGLRRAQLVGRAVCTLFPVPEAAAHRQFWSGLAAGRRDRYELLGSLRHVDGTLTEHRFVASLVRDATGTPAGAVACALPHGSGGGRPLPASRRPNDGELSVLALLAAGRSIGQIAVELGLTRRGVDYRLSRLRSKLRADGPGGVPATGAALVARAYVLGVLEQAAWPPSPYRVRGPG